MVTKKVAILPGIVSIHLCKPVFILKYSITELALLPKKYILMQNSSM